jgi:uncharacterized protein
MRRLLAAAVIAAACTGFAGAQPVPSGEATLTVHGQGRVQVPPDRANLTVEVQTNGKTLDAATTAHRERAERALKALQGLQGNGLKIERSTFQLNEVYPPSAQGTQPSQSKAEYQAATTFELTLNKLDAIDATVTAIAATGLFEVRNIRLGIGDRDPGLKAARKNAVDDARDKAMTYAEAAGVQLGGILRLDDGESRGPMEFAAAPASMMRGVKVIPPDTLTLSAAVTITWRLAKP